MSRPAFGHCALGLCLLSLVGCFSGAGLGRATTLPVGQTRGTAWIEASALTAQLAGPITLPWGLLGLGVQHGVHPRVEVGGRLTWASIGWLDSVSVTGDTKLQLRRRERGLDLALVPSIGWHMVRYGGTPWHALDVNAAFMAGWNLGAHQLVATTRVGLQHFGGRGQEPVTLGHFDLSLGVVVRLSARWELIPELLLSVSPTRFNGESQDDDRVGTGMLQLAVGVARIW